MPAGYSPHATPWPSYHLSHEQDGAEGGACNEKREHLAQQHCTQQAAHGERHGRRVSWVSQGGVSHTNLTGTLASARPHAGMLAMPHIIANKPVHTEHCRGQEAHVSLRMSVHLSRPDPKQPHLTIFTIPKQCKRLATRRPYCHQIRRMLTSLPES